MQQERLKRKKKDQQTADEGQLGHNAAMIKANHKVAMHVSTVSIIVNVLLSAFKFIAGILANSGAMISDAVHSASRPDGMRGSHAVGGDSNGDRGSYRMERNQ